jgi:hypothetical protein
MAKTTFAGRQVLTAAHANAFNNPQFTVDEGGEEFDGQHLRIRDAALSNDATQIKGRVNTFFNEFQVSAGTGLSVNVVGGSFTQDTGLRQVLSATSIAVAASSTNYVFINSAGAIVSSTIIPARWVPLAQVATSSSAVTSVIDLRERFKMMPRADAIKAFGGSGDQGDFTISGATTLSEGEYWFRNFTVTNTGTLTIPAAIRIYVSGNVLIQGAINVGTPMLGGSDAVIIFATSGTQNAGTGQGAARNFFGGGSYNYSLSVTGSGGATGSASGSAAGFNVFTGLAGAGGGFLYIEAGGTITIAAGAAITNRGSNAANPVINTSTNLQTASGGGGGSGGLVLLKSLASIAVSGVIDVRGGNGGNAGFAATGFRAGGGGGGGGGQIVLIAPTVSTTGSTLSLQGGAIGTSLGSAALQTGGGGGGGFGGVGGNALDTGQTAGSAGQLIVRTLKATV